MEMNQRFANLIALIVLAGSTLSCSTLPEVKTQAYAKLKDEQTFETDFPTLWKAIESVVRQIKITERDPSEVSPTELKGISKRTLSTDWIYSKSQTKYINYEVNGLPRKTYLQNRYKYKIVAEKVLGGVRVKVINTEEVEHFNTQGSPTGYSDVGDPDSNLASDLLEKINLELRSTP
jgi:hypothetical protein